MMWFKKKQRENNLVSDTVAKWIATGIVSAQRRLADRLTGWESRVSLRTKKLAVMIFFTISALYFVFLLGRSLLVAGRDIPAVARPASITPSQLPMPVYHTDSIPFVH